MRILYLDTSSSNLYISLYENGNILQKINMKLANDMSSCALPNLAKILSDCDIKPNDVEKIILVNGPGSFTGIRIGVTIAKVYAWSKNIPITTISSLEAMALSSDEEFDYIIPMIDARREAVYAAIMDSNNIVVMKEQYTTLKALKIAIEGLPNKVIAITNDEGINIDIKTIKYVPNFLKIIETYKDRENLDPHFIDANYLKKTEAEEKRDNTND